MIAVAFRVQLLVGLLSAVSALVSHRISNSKRNDLAIVTLIDGVSAFQGSQVLGCSLADFAASSNIDMLALCFNLGPQDKQLAFESGWTCTDVEQIPNPGRVWPFDYTMKIAPFALTQYRRILVVDSDMVVVNPRALLDLFRRPLSEGHIMATPDCFTPFTFAAKLQRGKAAPQIQAGAFLLEPSLHMYEDLKAAVPTTPSLDGGGQGFMSEFFEGKVQWLEAKYDYVRSTFCVGMLSRDGFYNLDGNATEHDLQVANKAQQLSVEDAENRVRRDIQNGDVAIVHFQAKPKPWDCLPDPNRTSTCGKSNNMFGNTGIAALYEIWRDVADTCLGQPDP